MSFGCVDGPDGDDDQRVIVCKFPTRYQIVNNTDDPVEIELVFDRARLFGAGEADPAEVMLRLQRYAHGEGVTMISTRPGRFANRSEPAIVGVYRVLPREVMLVCEVIDPGPALTFDFDELVVSTPGASRGYHSAVIDAFERRGPDPMFELLADPSAAPLQPPLDLSQIAVGPDNEVSWEDAKILIQRGDVKYVAQSHARDVVIQLRTGASYRAVEPEIDDVIRWVETCGKRDRIAIMTE